MAHKYGRTGVLVDEAGIYPHRCTRCGSTNRGFTSWVDDEQNRGYTSWSWQCQGCGKIVSLTRATVIRRWKEWSRERMWH
jgi:hypothetical protein